MTVSQPTARRGFVSWSGVAEGAALVLVTLVPRDVRRAT
jgi:hypothetical protein